jgi:hypothetical protein
MISDDESYLTTPRQIQMSSHASPVTDHRKSLCHSDS